MKNTATIQVMRTVFGLIGALIIVYGIYATINTTHTPKPTASDSGNIVISSPLSDETVGTAFVASGKARVFENQFNWDVLDATTHTLLVSGTAYAYAPDTGQFGYYSIPVHIPTTFSGTTIIFEAFDYSAKDGTKQDVASVSLIYDPSIKQTTVAIYLGNTPQSANDCSIVFPVYRAIDSTQSIASSALAELLKGPTTPEKTSGLFTSIPDGVSIQKVTLTGKTISADFDQALDGGVAGSCRVSSIRSQITETLKQFPTVSDVVISIDGRTADILQP